MKKCLKSSTVFTNKVTVILKGKISLKWGCNKSANHSTIKFFFLFRVKLAKGFYATIKKIKEKWQKSFKQKFCANQAKLFAK